MQIRRGFTIVELLIVVVIIAILAAITVVAYNGVRIRAQAATIGDEFKTIERALLLYKHSLGLSSWPTDSDATYWTGTGNPSIASIIAAQPAFRDFLQSVPAAPVGTINVYAFDNDLDTYNGCSNASSGVNIYINGTTTADTALMQAVDDAIDDGNLACGRVRFTGTSFHYNVALNQNG
jgi:prepilin-type N-terminal cleavage/methylation domain-containing protein